MATATCLLLPSVREGYGLVVVEAARLGTPSVVVDRPRQRGRRARRRRRERRRRARRLARGAGRGDPGGRAAAREHGGVVRARHASCRWPGRSTRSWPPTGVQARPSRPRRRGRPASPRTSARTAPCRPRDVSAFPHTSAAASRCGRGVDRAAARVGALEHERPDRLAADAVARQRPAAAAVEAHRVAPAGGASRRQQRPALRVAPGAPQRPAGLAVDRHRHGALVGALHPDPVRPGLGHVDRRLQEAGAVHLDDGLRLAPGRHGRPVAEMRRSPSCR